MRHLNNTTTKPLNQNKMKQTAMQQLLAQLKHERANIPMDIEWDRCYQAIETVIVDIYVPIEKEQIIQAYETAMETDIYNEPLKIGKDYYNQTFKS